MRLLGRPNSEQCLALYEQSDKLRQEAHSAELDGQIQKSVVLFECGALILKSLFGEVSEEAAKGYNDLGDA